MGMKVGVSISPRPVFRRPVRAEVPESSDSREKDKSETKLTVCTEARRLALISGLEWDGSVTTAPVEKLAVTGQLVEVVARDGSFTQPYVWFQLAVGVFFPARFAANRKQRYQKSYHCWPN